MKNSTFSTLIATLFLLVICAALWLGFGPSQLGGPVSYIIISGNSMEPAIELDDLVIARQQRSYQVNEQVLYNHPQVGFVFHRIIDRDQNGFILKGDNNDWLDSFQPTQADIIGRYWFMIPGVGKIIRTLREPAYFVSFVILIAGIIAILFLFPDQDSRRNKKGSKNRMRKSQNSTSGGDYRQDLLLCFGLLALAAIVLGVVVFTRSLEMTITDDVVYQHGGEFSYSASDVGDIYDRTGIETGDPIYPLLTCEMDLVYSYHISSLQFLKGERSEMQGSIRMTASLSDADGWNRSFLLVPDYEFKGGAVIAPATLDICKLLNFISDKELKTGTEIRAYTLAILPEVQISGTVNGNDFEDYYRPEIEFLLGQTVLRLADGQENGPLMDQERVIPRSRVVATQMVIFGSQVQIRTLRWVAGVLLGLSLLGAVYPAWSLYGDWKMSQESRIRVQNQPLLVDIKAGGLKAKGLAVIELATFQDLRKIADRYGAMIMHEVSGSTHRYGVQDGSYVYVYEMENEQKTADDEQQ